MLEFLHIWVYIENYKEQSTYIFWVDAPFCVYGR